MTERQWLDILAFNRIQPIGDEQFDYRFAMQRLDQVSVESTAQLEDCLPAWSIEVLDENAERAASRVMAMLADS